MKVDIFTESYLLFLSAGKIIRSLLTVWKSLTFTLRLLRQKFKKTTFLLKKVLKGLFHKVLFWLVWISSFSTLCCVKLYSLWRNSRFFLLFGFLTLVTITFMYFQVCASYHNHYFFYFLSTIGKKYLKKCIFQDTQRIFSILQL